MTEVTICKNFKSNFLFLCQNYINWVDTNIFQKIFHFFRKNVDEVTIRSKNFKSKFDFENTPLNFKSNFDFENILFLCQNYTNWVNMNVFQKLFTFSKKMKNVDEVMIRKNFKSNFDFENTLFYVKITRIGLIRTSLKIFSLFSKK